MAINFIKGKPNKSQVIGERTTKYKTNNKQKYSQHKTTTKANIHTQ
jgi:hypothetical protein